jgi:hypothetical protein
MPVVPAAPATTDEASRKRPLFNGAGHQMLVEPSSILSIACHDHVKVQGMPQETEAAFKLGNTH